MKCKQCSKIIPDGFTDCPWCGAVYSSLPAARAQTVPPPAPPMPVRPQAPSSLNVVLAWISSVFSVPLVTFAAYSATLKRFGTVALENYGFAIGGFVGPYLVSAIVVFTFFWIRKSKPHYSSKLLGVACGASLFAILSLVGSMPSSAGIDSRTSRTGANPVRGSVPPMARSVAASKWDPTIRAFFADLHAFDEQYLLEVGQFDNSSLPVYTPESFRDTATIQQILSQLHGRLTVAEKFNSIEPLFTKMPDHAMVIDASEEEKKAFLEHFGASTRKDLGARKVVADTEHDWLTASISLYEYTLSRQGGYVLRDGNLIFKSNAAAGEFNRKSQDSQRLRAQFYYAYRAAQNQLATVMAQYGLQPSDFDTSTRH